MSFFISERRYSEALWPGTIWISFEIWFDDGLHSVG